MATIPQKHRWRILQENIGCIVCRILGHGYREPDMHHIVDLGYRKHSGGHWSTESLCVWHHRGYPEGNYSVAHMVQVFGPSLARSKREFIARFGTERQLLTIVDALYRLCLDEESRGAYLPSHEIDRYVALLHREVVQGEELTKAEVMLVGKDRDRVRA